MIDTGAFLAGVGVLVTLDVLSLTFLQALAKSVGEDPQAREAARRAAQQSREAQDQAQSAHRRVSLHIREDHDREPHSVDDLVADGGRRFPHEDEPDGDVTAPHHFYVGVVVAVFGFWSVWDLYPVTGAGMVLVGLLVALDDAVSHAFGWPTPLDLVWKKAIYPVVMKRLEGWR